MLSKFLMIIYNFLNDTLMPVPRKMSAELCQQNNSTKKKMKKNKIMSTKCRQNYVDFMSTKLC